MNLSKINVNARNAHHRFYCPIFSYKAGFCTLPNLKEYRQ